MVKFRGLKPRKGPLPFRYVFLLTFVFFIFSTTFGLWIINEGLKPTLVSYAESQTRKIATLVINKAITKRISDETELNNIFIVVENKNYPPIIKLDTEIMNRIQSEITNLVQVNINVAEKGNIKELARMTNLDIVVNDSGDEEGIVYYVPLGQATNNALLGNLGPRIPIKFNVIGSVESDIQTENKAYGINNTYLRAFIHLRVDIQIIIPFATEITTLEQEIPIAEVIIPGEVPEFYNGNGQSSPPAIQVPNN